MAVVHCNMKISDNDTYFLYDTDKFIKRKLHITVCPVCESLLARLEQVRVSDNKYFSTTYKKAEAEKAIDKYSRETNYKASELPQKTNDTYGLCYGTYTEHKKDGKIYKITEKASDFYGNNKVLSKIEID